ncbi:MAG: integration host factor subunit beta [Roseovarius sp.]
MIRSELVARLAAENPHLTYSDAENVVSTIFDTIVRHLEKGGRVEFRGLGAFTVRRRNPKNGRNPSTGELVVVEGKSVPFFKAGKKLRDRVNAATA